MRLVPAALAVLVASAGGVVVGRTAQDVQDRSALNALHAADMFQRAGWEAGAPAREAQARRQNDATLAAFDEGQTKKDLASWRAVQADAAAQAARSDQDDETRRIARREAEQVVSEHEADAQSMRVRTR